MIKSSTNIFLDLSSVLVAGMLQSVIYKVAHIITCAGDVLVDTAL
jgi:hypothetical protein